MRAICTVIINTDKLLCIGRKIACTEPYNIIPAVAKARNKRIVGIKNKLSFGMNTILYGIVNPFRMTVSCELVTVKVCDNIMSRCDVFEGIFCKAFVTFNEKNIRFNLARKSTTAENKSCNTLNLVRTLFVPGNFFAAFTKNMCNHLNGRCLAVTACYGNNIFRQLNSSENIGAELKRNLSRQTAALAEQSSDKFQNLAHNNSK